MYCTHIYKIKDISFYNIYKLKFILSQFIVGLKYHVENFVLLLPSHVKTIENPKRGYIYMEGIYGITFHNNIFSLKPSCNNIC